jgi:glycosyltransferase involved in cell wall biosynthesis
LHIANFTNSYLPVVSGVVTSLSSFRKALTELGHRVFVFAQEDDYQDREPFIFRYPSLTLPLETKIPAVVPISPFIDRLIPSLKLDLIHSHHPILLGQAAANKANELNLPLVFTFHSQYREYTNYIPIPQEAVQKFLKSAVNHWLREYMRKCQHIVVPSESMLEILKNEYGLESHYTVVPTGIDLGRFLETDGSAIRSRYGWETNRVMISIGRLAPEKNWRTLLSGAALAMKTHQDLKLIILGDGPDRRTLQDFCSDLGVSNRITFTGEVPISEVPAYLIAADLFIFASINETQGLVTLEALASGLPVVAVDASGTRDIVEDGCQGLLVENKPEALADAIGKLFGNHDLYAKFQSATVERAAIFDIQRSTNKLVGVYEQAIRDKRENITAEVRTPK